MDRKGIIAIGIAIISLFVWSHFYTKQVQTYQQERALAEQRVAEAKKAELAASTPEAAPAFPADPGAPMTPAIPGATPAAAPVEAKTERHTTPMVDFAFTNLGGGISRALLPQHLAEGGAPVELNQFGAIPIGTLSFKPGEEPLAAYQVTGTASADEITFERQVGESLHIAKKFILPKSGAPEAYQSHLEVRFTNAGPSPLVVPAYYIHTGSAAPVHQRDMPALTGFGWLRGGKFTFKDSTTFSSGGFLWMGRADSPVFTESLGDGTWAGVANQYFTTLVTARERKGSGVWVRRFPISRHLVGVANAATKPNPPSGAPAETLNAVEGALAMPGFTLEPGKTETAAFNLFTGPREYRRLKNLGSGEDAIMDFGMFRAVCKLLLNSMNVLHAWLGHSYAAAIVVLTLIIRGLMWPLQNKGTQSMKRMQALAPELNALKEKYADDPQRMSQEQMKLYKTYGINPVSGCLPMLVQIPIFFGFYSMLGKAVELRNSHFLWVKDFSQPDTVATIFGYPLNVLPLFMMITMIGQMKLSPKAGDPMQQRIAMFIPIIFIVFCYNYASALALYLTVQNLFSIVQLYVTRDQKTPALQKVIPPGKKKR